MAKKLENMDDEEFMAAWTSAAEELEKARAKVREFADERQRRDAMARLETMSDEEKRQLAQFAYPEGIKSEESVNNG